MIGLARALEIEVVAEGVETSDQLEQVVNLQCNKVQGFLFSRPVTTAVATELIAHQRICNPSTWKGENGALQLSQSAWSCGNAVGASVRDDE